LVFCLFLRTKHKGPLNKLQVWGYSDAIANATAPCWPTMLEELFRPSSLLSFLFLDVGANLAHKWPKIKKILGYFGE